MSEPTAEEIRESICEEMHDAYEAAASQVGWATQERSRKPWCDVPEANKATMRAMVDAVVLPRIAALEAEKNGAYSERNTLVAFIAHIAPSEYVSIEQHYGEDWEDDWRNVVYIDTPDGQVSWHLHDSELPLFAGIQRDQGRTWDGHTTEEKYERLLKSAQELRE